PLVARVEMPVARVERQREEALRAPLEAVLLAARRLDRRAAAPIEDVDHLLEEVLLRRGRAAGRDLQDIRVDEISPPLEQGVRAERPQPSPGLDLDRQ